MLVNTSCKRLIAALAVIVPAAALVSTPVLADDTTPATTSPAKTHHTSHHHKTHTAKPAAATPTTEAK